MSDFREKLFKGIKTSPEEWYEELKKMHASNPGMTYKILGPFKTAEGENSYEILAKSLIKFSGKKIHLLDLGCGDGHLIPYCFKHIDKNSNVLGIDQSPEEIEIAKSSALPSNISFECASADKLTIPDNFYEVILSHMAVMLMDPFEPVFNEIVRVLKPGGLFSAVITGDIRKDKFLTKYEKLMNQFLTENYPNMKEPQMGDSRFKTTAGIREIFKQPLFDSVTVDEFSLHIKLAKDSAWDTFFKQWYLVSMLPEELK